MMGEIQSTVYNWKNVNIGGGGYATGLIIHPKEANLMYVRTDVGGAYRWDIDNKCWVQLMDQFGLENRNFYGVDGFAIDACNTDVLYVAAGKYSKKDLKKYYSTDELEGEPCDVLKSMDRGKTWIRTGLNKDFSGNLDLRWNGECIAVDPKNSDIIFCGTRNDGLWISNNATTSMGWEKNNNLLLRSELHTIRSILFDLKSFNGYRCMKIYVSIYGDGLYISEDGGESWLQMEDSPLHINRMVLADETLYMTAGYHDYEKTDSTKGVFKLNNRKISNITPDKVYKEYNGISVDPTNPNRIVCSIRFNGFWNPIFISLDAGENWEYILDQCQRKCDVPWWTSGYFSASTSSVTIDPHDPNRIWMTDWYGIWTTENVTSKPSLWQSYTKGYESMVSFTLVCPPTGANLITGIADNDGMRHDNLNKFPLKKHGGPDMQETTGIDFYERDTDFMVRVGSWDWGKQGSGGYTTDNGRNWSKFASWPFGANGKIAISSDGKENIVVLPIQEGPKYTMDGGVNWQDCEGVPSDSICEFWSWNHPMASDRVNGKYFYIYNNGNIYVSSNRGKSFKAVYRIPHDSWHNLKSVPGIGGEFWISLNKNGLYIVSDYGNEIKKMKHVNQAYLFGFGKNPAGKKHPTLFVYGTVSGEKGIFRSDNYGESFLKINDASHNIGNDPNCLEGDRQVFGRVYIGTNGRGFYYGEPENS